MRNELGGRVARIRVNPQDAMGVADVLHALGVDDQRFSFDQAVRIALSSLLESARAHGAIPRRDGFEYSNLMARFIERVPDARKQKLQVTSLFHGQGEHYQVKPLIDDPVVKKRRVQYEELLFKRKNNSENWTEADQAVFAPLYDEFAPR